MKIQIQTLLIAISLLAYSTVYSQTYNILNYSGQTVTTCSGTFTDMGGTAAGYSGNQDDSITFFPSTVGASVELNFSQFDIASGDNLQLYDGPNTSANLLATFSTTLSPVGMLISASILNPSGALTLRWISSGSAPGWEASLNCGLPCQNYSVELLSSSPPFHLDTGFYYIDVCPGDSVHITAKGVYGLNDSVYHQSDATTDFIWDMANYYQDTNLTVSTYYDTIGGYDISLIALDSNGCLSNQTPKIRIRMSTQPNLNSTYAISNPICQQDTTSLFGEAIPLQWHASSSLNHAGITYLPDGSGVSYVSTLLFTVFNPNDVIQSPLDVLSINATLEHSFLGDLNIKVTCPNGQSATLKSYPGGSGTFLGEPIDQNSQQVPGIGYEYSWKPTGTITMLNAVGAYTYNYTNASGASVTNHDYLPPSTGYPANATITGPQPLVTYLPETPYNNLIGCPLNGAWSITVTDNLGIDNGFIFAWGIDFAPSVLPDSWDYIPAIATEAWDASSDIIINNGQHIVVQPQSAGIHDYTFTAVDDFGCTYDTTIHIDVKKTPEVNLGNDTVLCKSSITDVIIFDATNSISGATYMWSTGNTAATNMSNITSDIWVEVSKNYGAITCKNSDTIHLDAFDMATVDLGNDTCVTDNKYTLYAGNRGHNPPFIYLWNDGSTADSLVVNQSGLYSVTVAIDPSSPCVVEDEIQLSLFEDEFLGEDQEFCNFEEIIINVGIDGESHNYTWLFDGNAPTINYGNIFQMQYIEVGDHVLTLDIDNGCHDEVKLTSLDCQLEIPNVITPNGDGYNEAFVVDGLENFPNSILKIYNRWGKKVYESNNYTNDWDGENVTDGVYFYNLITTVGNEDIEYKGSLTIMR